MARRAHLSVTFGNLWLDRPHDANFDAANGGVECMPGEYVVFGAIECAPLTCHLDQGPRLRHGLRGKSLLLSFRNRTGKATQALAAEQEIGAYRIGQSCDG